MHKIDNWLYSTGHYMFFNTLYKKRIWKTMNIYIHVSNESILKEINPEYSLEGLTLKLKLQYFCPLIRWANSLEKTLMLEKTEGRRRRGCRGWDGWMASLTQGTWIWTNSGRRWRTGKPGKMQFMGLQRVRHDLVTEQQYMWLNHYTVHLKLTGSPASRRGPG